MANREKLPSLVQPQTAPAINIQPRAHKNRRRYTPTKEDGLTQSLKLGAEVGNNVVTLTPTPKTICTQTRRKF